VYLSSYGGIKLRLAACGVIILRLINQSGVIANVAKYWYGAKLSQRLLKSRTMKLIEASING